MSAADAPSPPRPARSRLTPGLLAILGLAILATFGRLLGSDFTWWDDQGTLHHNPLFNPPTHATLARYWGAPALGLYVPVTETVWAAIARLAYVGVPDEFNVSLNPWLFHAANLALHLGSAALVLAILRRLFEAPAPALAGALLFALHPLQVESVAWISGLKDLLCWFGTLAIVWIYLRRTRAVAASGGALWASWEMPAATLVLALAILSKPTAIVAPAALLAIDGLLGRRRWRRASVELLPLFALSAAGAAVARVAQEVGPQQDVAVWLRPFVVGDALVFYARKFVWPVGLIVDHGRTPTSVLAGRWAYVGWVGPAAVAAALFARRRTLPALALAGAIVVIGIAPVSGVATFQMQQFSTTADHYVYFSMLGPAIALAWALTRWPARSIRAGVGVALVALAARSFDQCRHWRDTFALFEYAMSVNPRSFAAQNNLAAVQLYRQVPRLDLARRHARVALSLQPDNYYALMTLGSIEARLGNGAGAAAAFDRLWALSEQLGVGRSLRADIAREAFASMISAGEYRRAIAWAERSVALAPDDYRAKSDLAFAIGIVARMRDATTTQAAPTTTAPTTSSPSASR